MTVLLPGAARALDPNKNIHQYNCQTWSQHHGLPCSGINAIAQSQDGYLWLGGSVGLVRFDGIKFTVVPLPSEARTRTTEIVNLSPRSEGGVWAAIKLSGYGAYDGKWMLGPEALDGTELHMPQLLETRDRKVWLGGDCRGIRLPGGRLIPMFAKEDEPPYVAHMMEDSRGRVWVSRSPGGLRIHDNGQWTNFTHPRLDAAVPTALAEGTDGTIWVGTDYSLGRFTPEGELISMSYPGKVTCLVVDRQGTLWAGTAGNGLLRFANQSWSSLQKTDGLADNVILSLAEDREGSIWIGTRSGLNQLTDVKLSTFGITEGLGADSAIGVSASPRGGVWVGTGKGGWYFDGKEFSENCFTNANLPYHYVKRIFEATNGDLYLQGGENEVLIVAGGHLVARHKTVQMAVAFMEDSQSVIVSAGGDLYRVGRDHITPFTYTNGTPEFYWIHNLANGRDGSILVSSVNGLFRLQGGMIERWAQEEGFTEPLVSFAFEDQDGTIWAGSPKGIARVRGRKVQCVGRADGLPDALISAIVPDAHGTFWVDANRGIYSVTRKELNDFLDGKSPKVNCVRYEGLGAVKPTDKYHQEQLGCRTADGRIWFPGSRGAIMIDPAAIRTNTLPPIVHIEGIRANGTDFPVGPGITVPPGRGELAFRFTGLSYIAPQSLRFRYRLEGYDHTWVETEDNRMAVYANLMPGRYTFKVIAANADGVWDTTGKQVSVELLPHFHQTAWFYVLCAVAAVTSLMGVYLWRIRHLHNRQAALQRARDELEREVDKRTAELAHANASLRKEESLLKQRTLLLEQEIEQRTQIQREVERIHRELLQASRMAGMAEVATSVLHNVGNVLNSVNVSTTLLHDRIKGSKVTSVGRVAALINSHTSDLAGFITADPKGQQLPRYLNQLADSLAEEQSAALTELAGLQKNIGHIKDIVAMQQSYAKVAGVIETVKVSELMEDALRMNEGALERHGVRYQRQYDPTVSEIMVDRHKVIQILVNLIRNGKYACDDSGSADKRMTLRITGEDGRVQLSVIDNGVGIPSENLTRIFNHGFTTRKNGHGFGLHSGALAAKELGGSLQAYSDGPGQGARFTLDLPLQPPKAEKKLHAAPEPCSAIHI